MASVAEAAGGRLRVTEVFRSLQGEADTAGWPTVFVRLTGCPLRCGYCDRAYAFGGGVWRDLDGLVAEVSSFRTQRVCVTGGEPLAQRLCIELLRRLCDAGHRVSLETSGAMPLEHVDPRVIKDHGDIWNLSFVEMLSQLMAPRGFFDPVSGRVRVLQSTAAPTRSPRSHLVLSAAPE